MSDSNFNTLGKVLAVASIAEVATGVALLIVPALGTLALLGVEGAIAEALARLVGIALLTLGIACWPVQRHARGDSAAYWAMQSYNALIALYLAYLGIGERLGGVLLWPAVGLHAVMSLLLVGARRTGL
ncbi:hypothetical protein [Variovorax sp. J31P207]|uniref:hypothetical protein n=1 Tax=Variovorax sp. J31P207 TaxID=3053510 RepID=UPI00257504B1|nr:hypothetical protein [Variovorax sp. J31P207]MDM0072149.1 hypothetical protein [Variovorax sp. J31P207]